MTGCMYMCIVYVYVIDMAGGHLYFGIVMRNHLRQLLSVNTQIKIDVMWPMYLTFYICFARTIEITAIIMANPENVQASKLHFSANNRLIDEYLKCKCTQFVDV